MGFKITLFTVRTSAILGGVGSPYGAMAGGLVVGIAEEVDHPFIGEAPLVSPGYKTGVAFALMVIMLDLAPSDSPPREVFWWHGHPIDSWHAVVWDSTESGRSSWCAGRTTASRRCQTDHARQSGRQTAGPGRGAPESTRWASH
ncbi:MAG: hypothetical protein R3F54_23895 [Alphaproteobacteria bacterium]